MRNDYETFEVEFKVKYIEYIKENIKILHGCYYPDVCVKRESKISTRVDNEYEWPIENRKYFTSLNTRNPQDYSIRFNLIDAKATDKGKLLVCSARLPLSKVIDAAGLGNRWTDTLELMGPAGRVGKARVEVVVRKLTNSARANGQESYAQPNDQVKKRKLKSQCQNINFGNADMKLSTNEKAIIINIGGVVKINSAIPTTN